MTVIKNLFILAILTVVLCGQSQAASIERQVSVSGVCNRMVTPDRASIILTVEFQDMDLKTATHKVSESYERVQSQIKNLRLENANLRTVEYSVNEIREWEKDHQVMKGFRARMGLWISTSEIQRLGDVINIASQEKVKNVGALQTFLSDDKQLEEHLACLKDAAENAKVKAEKLAHALGAHLGEVLTVTEGEVSAPRGPRPEMMMQMENSGGGRLAKSMAPAIEAGQQNVALTLSVSFGLK